MTRKNDEVQQTLRVLTAIDDTPGKEHKDPNGQVLLFGTNKVLVPAGFTDFANLMNGRWQQTNEHLEQTKEQLNISIEENRELGKTLKSSTEQNRRLANSLEQIIPKFIDQSVNHTQPDLVFGQLSDGENADVVIVDGTSIPAEAIYTLSTGEIADIVGNEKMSPTRMANILRDLGFFGDSKFHHTLPTSKKGFCQKYKPCVVEEIYKRLANPESYNLCKTAVTKAANFIRPKEALN